MGIPTWEKNQLELRINIAKKDATNRSKNMEIERLEEELRRIEQRIVAATENIQTQKGRLDLAAALGQKEIFETVLIEKRSKIVRIPLTLCQSET